MTDEVRAYAQKRITEKGIRMVHCPDFGCREDVDMFVKMTAYLSKRGKETMGFWNMTKVPKEKYSALLVQLKRNRDNVPLDILKTKYQKPFNELQNRLRVMTVQIVYDVVLYGLLIRYEDADQVYEEINQMIDDSYLTKEISHAVFQDQDIGKVEEKTMELREKVHEIAERWLDSSA